MVTLKGMVVVARSPTKKATLGEMDISLTNGRECTCGADIGTHKCKECDWYEKPTGRYIKGLCWWTIWSKWGRAEMNWKPKRIKADNTACLEFSCEGHQHPDRWAFPSKESPYIPERFRK